jgi:hypothetical protein
MKFLSRLALISGILISTLSASGFFTVNYTQIDNKFYKNEAQNGAGFGFGAVYDTKIVSPFVEIDFSGNGSSTYRSTAIFGIEKNIVDNLNIGLGYGYTHLVAHSQTQNVGTFVAKAEYLINKKYVVGYKYSQMQNVAPYDNATLYNNDKRDVDLNTIYIGFKY